MTKLLYIISIIILIEAGILFINSGMQWIESTSKNNFTSEVSILERFQMFGTPKSDVKRNSPLIEKATEFALYLNPPKPPKTMEASLPVVKPQPYRPSTVTAKFRLLSTSYYLANPEKSLALVSEPGKGEHWVKKGFLVGNFVVDSVDKGAIFYKDANQIYKMNITVPEESRISKIFTEDKILIEDKKTESDKESKTPVSNEILSKSRELSNTLKSAGFLAKE